MTLMQHRGPLQLTHVKHLNCDEFFWTPPVNNKCQISWLLNKKGRKQVLFGYLFKGGPDAI